MHSSKRMFGHLRCRLLIVVMAVTLTGCSAPVEKNIDKGDNPMTKSRESVVKKDVFVQFQSRVGNQITHPSQWSVEDKGETFILRSPDQQAMISAYTCTVEGSGSLPDFQELLLSAHPGNWQESQWTDIDISGVAAKKRYLMPPDEKANSAWRVYVLKSGDCYHALRINARPDVMELNGGFYEQIVQTFKGL